MSDTMMVEDKDALARKLEREMLLDSLSGNFVSGRVRNRRRHRLEELIGTEDPMRVHRGQRHRRIRGGQECPRNDPCPCGSGRKYKYCCRAAGRLWRRPAS